MNKQEIKKLIGKESPFVLDIGCYDGKDSIELAEVLKCKVHCFEPDPLSQEIFRLKHGATPLLELYPYALGSRDAEISFYQSDHPQSNSIRKPKEHLNLFPNVRFDEVVNVQCMKLDTWYASHGEGRIVDFIWADVNGCEFDLIEGGHSTLKNTRFLYIECSKKELYTGQKHYSMLEKELPGFKMEVMYNWGENFGNILLKNTKL